MDNKREKNRARPPNFFWWVPLSMSHVFFFLFASFSIELNEVGTSIKKPTSLIVCDYVKILLVSRKT